MIDRTVQLTCFFAFLFFAISVSFVRHDYDDADHDTEIAIIQERTNCDKVILEEGNGLLKANVIESIRPFYNYDRRTNANAVLNIWGVELRMIRLSQLDKDFLERVVLCRTAMGYLEDEGKKNTSDPYILPGSLVNVDIFGSMDNERRHVIRLSVEGRGMEIMERARKYMKGKDRTGEDRLGKLKGK